MRRFKKKVWNVILLLLTTIVFIGTSCSYEMIHTKAEADLFVPEKVKEIESGVLKLASYAADEKGNKYYIKQGTGFLIGNISSEDTSISILTDQSLLDVEEEALNTLRRQNGLSTDSSFNMGIDIVLDMGTTIAAETVSKGDYYAVLKPAAALNNVSCLRLGESNSLQMQQSIYALGYGGNSNVLGIKALSNLTLKEYAGQITEISAAGVITNLSAQTGNIGAPLVDEEGYTVGFFAEGENGELQIKLIDDIKDILKTLNIAYQGIDTSNHYNEVTDEISKELNQLLLECEELAMNQDQYTKKSLNKLKTAINTAISVTLNKDATFDDYQNSIDELTKYKKKLHKKDFSLHVIQVVIGILILFFVLLIIRTNAQIRKISNWTVAGSRMNSPGNSSSSGGAALDMIVYARLIRQDNGQKIDINNKMFQIGKNPEGMDYVIGDNSSISRHHADIIVKDGAFFVIDHNSTNHTYINGKILSPGEYVAIKSGDILQLSNIKFTFEG